MKRRISPMSPRLGAVLGRAPSREPNAASIADENDFTLERLCRFCRKNRRAAAVVEFAVVAPCFLLISFGMLEYGRMVMVRQIITNSSREGARVAVLEGATTAEVASAVQTYPGNTSIPGAEVSVDPNSPSSAGYGEAVAVAVTSGFHQVSWLPSPMYLGGYSSSATTVTWRETID